MTPMQDPANMPRDLMCHVLEIKPSLSQKTEIHGGFRGGHTGIDCVPIPEHLRQEVRKLCEG